MLIDDHISSGITLKTTAHLLLEAGASAVATHCLASEADLQALRESGIASIRSTQTVAGPTACIDISGVLAREIRGRGLCPAQR